MCEDMTAVTVWCNKIILNEVKWQPTPVRLPRKSHGRRSLLQSTVHGGHKESDTTERLHFSKISVLLESSYRKRLNEPFGQPNTTKEKVPSTKWHSIIMLIPYDNAWVTPPLVALNFFSSSEGPGSLSHLQLHCLAHVTDGPLACISLTNGLVFFWS